MSVKVLWRGLRSLLRSTFTSTPSPYKLTYVVTKRCNSRCVNCDIWRVEPKDELNLREIEETAKGLPQLFWLDLTGGEATARQDIVEVAEVFMRNCPNLSLIHFPTNGLNTTRICDVANRLRARFDGRIVITVSIDGPPDLNDHLRGIKGDFDRSVETYRRLKEISGIEVYVGMTLYEANLGAVKELSEALSASIPGFRSREMHFNLGHGSSHYYENEAGGRWPSEQMLAALDFIRAQRGFPRTVFQVVEWFYLTLAKRYVHSRLSPIPCRALRSNIFISETGKLLPCSIWNEPVGDLRQVGYQTMELLSSDRGRELASRIDRRDCANCWTPCDAYPSILSWPLLGFRRPRESARKS